jgi:hypothetical protein
MMISDHDIATLANICRAAADQYLTDAHQQDVVNNPRLAEGFRSQAKAAREWADKFECAVTVSISAAANEA